MIQTLNDVYNLMKKPEFTMPFSRNWEPLGTYNLYNNRGDRIEIIMDKSALTVYTFHNKNSEYYETVSLKDPRGRAMRKKFHKMLFAKHIAAMVKDIEENYR